MGTIFNFDGDCRVVTPTGFYRDMATSEDDETVLATELWRVVVFVHGREKLLRLLKRDAAKVFAPLAYGRARIASVEVETPIVRGIDTVRGGKPGNEHILTPAHPKWRKFVRELKRETADFHDDGQDGGAFDGDDVPCAAQLILADLGLAIAESLVVLRAFGGGSDLDILRHVEDRWHGGRVRFYVDPAGRGEAYNGLLG